MNILIETVKILGSNYKLLRNVKDLRADNDNKLYGEINYMNLTISIRDEIPEDIMYETLLHEIVHGIDDKICGDLTENQVSRLASTLYCVMKDNKHLFKEMLKEDEKIDY